MKVVAIIGGGISGCFASIRIKEKHPEYDVHVFESNDKLLKKIYATGNGKCNFANSGSLVNKYKNERFVLNILRDFSSEDIVYYFDYLGIKSKKVGDLLYPYSESAETVASRLITQMEKVGVKVHLSSLVKDYSNGTLYLATGTFNYDALIISVGGKSSPKLGSNGNFYDVLLKHNYQIVPTFPSLCPIKVKENTKMVDGLRSKVHVSLFKDNQLIHEEDGELLFKKDGLSGIVIFNLTHYINELDDKNNVSIHIDFAKDMEGEYDSLVNPKIAKYLVNNKLDIHHTVFTFKDFYSYENSQVTSGGVNLKEISDDLESLKENKVYFIGEVLDVDAICGGYNIMWAFASAERVSKII